MADHRSPRAARSTRLTPRQVRALIALLTVALLTTGLGLTGTFAAWTDSATLRSGSIESGSLDISIDGSLVGQANNGGTVDKPQYAASNLVPGESFAFAFPVKNEGSTTFTYALTSTGTGDLAGTNGLRLTFYTGANGAGAASNNASGTGFRTGSCGSGTAGNPVTLNTTSTAASNRTLASGATDFYCLVLQLPSSAPNTLQGKSATVSLKVAADQLTS